MYEDTYTCVSSVPYYRSTNQCHGNEERGHFGLCTEELQAFIGMNVAMGIRRVASLYRHERSNGYKKSCKPLSA